MRNGSIVNEFILLGFSVPHWSRLPLSFCFMLLYAFIICGNVLIIILVKTEAKLHTPMYFFIANFSFLELWYTTVTVPRTIRDLIVDDTSMLLISCIFQFYFVMVCGGNEHCLLAVLSYDRFIAICHPLHYSMLMRPRTCVQLIGGAWIISFAVPASTAFSLFKARYCDDSIDHFFCDISPLLQIVCRESTKAGIVFYMLAAVIILSCFFMICLSYSFIVYTVLSIKSHEGRQQAFTTCASHITVVLIFYSSCIFMYIRPSAHKTFHGDKFVSLVYTLVAPLLNPMIYTFRNRAMKAAIRKKFNIQTKLILMVRNIRGFTGRTLTI